MVFLIKMGEFREIVKDYLSGAFKRFPQEVRALTTRCISLRRGRELMVGWESVNAPSAIVGPQKPRQQAMEEIGGVREYGRTIYVGLEGLPPEDPTRLMVEVAENLGITLANLGGAQIEVEVPRTGKDKVYGVFCPWTYERMGDKGLPEIDRETGRVILNPGQALALFQGGEKVRVSLGEEGDGRKPIVLTLERVGGYHQGDDGVVITYEGSVEK